MKNKKHLFSSCIILALAMIFNAACLNCVFAGDLVGYWKFDETGGNITNDSSGNGNKGTIFGATRTTQGKFGLALKFDGVDDYVNILHSSSLDITEKITVDAWVKGLDGQSAEDIYPIRKEDAYAMRVGITEDGSFKANYGGWVKRSAKFALVQNTLKNVLDNDWHHLVFTFDGEKIKTFVDDNFSGEQPLMNDNHSQVTGTIASSVKPLLFGSNFKGAIDEVKIYNRVKYYYGFDAYNLLSGEKVIIDDYANYKQVHYIFTLKSKSASSITFEMNRGAGIETVVLNLNQSYKLNETNISITFTGITWEYSEASVSFEPIVLPTPKWIELKQPNFFPDSNTKIVIGNSTDDMDNAKILQEYLSNLRHSLNLQILTPDDQVTQTTNLILIGSRKNNTRIGQAAKNISGFKAIVGNEGYHIYINKEYTILEAKNKGSGYYAVTTLIQLLENFPGLSFPGIEINDYPSIEGMRALHLTNIDQAGFNLAKETIEKAAKLKFNTVIIMVSSNGGLVVKLADPPFPLSEVYREGAITKEAMEDTINFARKLGLEVIPELKTGSKANKLFGNSHPELMLNKETYDPNNDKTYPLVYDILDGVIDIFQPINYVHIGHDELYGYCGDSMEEVEKAKGTDKPIAIMTPEEFAKDITTIHSHIKAKGLKTIMWADMFLNEDAFPNMDNSSHGTNGLHGKEGEIYKIIDKLPTDIIMGDWHYGPSSDFKFPTIDYLRNKGFQVLGATWFEPDTILSFSQYLLKQPVTGPKIQGMIATLWDQSNKETDSEVTMKNSSEAYWCGKVIAPDPTPPDKPEVKDEGDFTNQPYVSWSSSDEETGIAEYQYKIQDYLPGGTGALIRDWASTGTIPYVTVLGQSLPEGKICYFGVKAINGGGSSSTVGYSDGIKIDLTSPQTTAIGLDSLWHNAPVAVNFTVADNISGKDKTYRSINGASFAEYINPLTLSTDGVYNIVYYSTDKAGNKEQEKTGQVKIDATPPTTPGKPSISSGTNPNKTGIFSISWVASTDTLSGMKEYQVFRNNTKVATVATTTYSETNLAQGSHSYYVRAVDKANNLSIPSATSVTIVVDKTAPEPPVIDDGTLVESIDQLTASWSSTDLESSIAQYKYCIGTSKGASDTKVLTSAGTATLITATGLTLNRGITYYFTVKAIDKAGNESTGYSDGIKINSLPQVGTIAPSPGSSLADAAINVTITYFDPDGWEDIKNAFFLVNTSTAKTKCFYAYYSQNTNKLYLRNDANNTWLGGFAPGSGNIIENSYAKIDCLKTTISGLDNTLTINWNVTFKSIFKGVKNTYLKAVDDASLTTDFVKKGTWTI
jgi:hypothetical protein